MTVLSYTITLDEPVLVPQREGEPNSAVSHGYLPGSVLRGAFVARYLRGRRVDDLATDATGRRLFLDGTTRYLNGYPLIEGGKKKEVEIKRGLPVPLSWHFEKGSGNRNRANDLAGPEPQRDVSWERVERPFYASFDEVRLEAAEQRLAVHHARDREAGRATASDGEVFRYEALAAGQALRAFVLCEDEDAATLQALTEGPAWLGGSRTAGYGRTLFSKAEASEGATWREAAEGGAEQGTDEKLAITLLSDALVRGRRGTVTPDPQAVRQAISAYVGDLNEKAASAFMRTTIAGGFNRTWGLPLPQAHAVQRGSVFVYDDPGCTEEQIRKLEWEGIGERRAEGFGRVAVVRGRATHPIWHYVERESPDAKPEEEQRLAPGGEGRRLAQRMAGRMLRSKLDRKLAKEGRRHTLHVGPLTAAQLGWLRGQVRNALRLSLEAGRERLAKQLQGLEDSGTTSRQFGRARVAYIRKKAPLLKWVHTRLEDRPVALPEDGYAEVATIRSPIWQLLYFTRAKVPRIGDVEAALTEALAYEYNLRLVLGVLERAARKKREEAQ